MELITANEFFVLDANTESNNSSSKVNVLSTISVIVPADTFDDIPPPVVYLTVNVVFPGANPYVFVYTKFEGSIGKSNCF